MFVVDLYNFLTLVALGLSSYGFANIYSGKMLNDKGTQGKGIISLLVGFLAICWLNPIFPRSMFFSLLVMGVFAAIVLGYTANSFLKDKEIVNVEIIKENKEKKPVEDKPKEIEFVEEDHLELGQKSLLRSDIELPDRVPVKRKEDL